MSEGEDRPIADNDCPSMMKIAVDMQQSTATPPEHTADNPCQQSQVHAAATPAWMDSITGRDWEIYWSHSATTTTTTTDHEEEAGWYEAKVASRRGALFRVVFHGSDTTVYTMELSPAVVRPSVRTWMRKSVSLLQHHHEKGTVVHDTRTLWDTEAIAVLQRDVREEFPIAAQQEELPPQLHELRSQHVACCSLLEQVRIQLHLRACLGPLENDGDDEDAASTNGGHDDQQSAGEEEEDDEEYDDDRMNADGMEEDEDDDPFDPTDVYIEYLCHCLQQVERACIWHYRCWRLFLQLFGDLASDALPMERQVLIEHCRDGRQVLDVLSRTSDCSKAASERFDNENKQKRKHEDAKEGDDGGGRPGSKRRKGLEGEKVEVVVPKQNEDTLLDHDSITAFVQTAFQVDNRTVTQHCGDMLSQLSERIVSPYMTWERRAQFSLGERSSLQIANGTDDGEGETTTPDDSDRGRQRLRTMQKLGRRGSLSHRQTEFVSLKDLDALIHDAKTDSFLQRFPISAYVTQLEEKVAAVLQFETRAWELVSAVLDAAAPQEGDEGDQIQQGLQHLWHEATKKNGTVSNIHPIGREASSLSRTVLENAMVYREWYLDLIHAETVRERVAFVDTLVSRLSKLPPLPSLANSNNLSSKLGQVASRAQALWSICLDNLGLFSRYQSVLEERRPNADAIGAKFVSVTGVQDLLREMGQLKVISTAEEMLAVRLDVLLWGDEVQKMFWSVTPSYEDVAASKTSATRVLEGKSESRQALRAGLRHSSAVEAEIKAFAHSDMETIPAGGGYSKVNSMFVAANDWKQRADWILRAIADGNTKNVRPVKLIEPRRIRDLIAEHPKLGVNCKEEFRTLNETHAAVVEWTTCMQSLCSSETLGFDRLLSVLKERRTNVSPALALRPSWEVIDGLISSLQWCEDARNLTLVEDDNFQELRRLLSQGADLIRRYSLRHGIRELVKSSFSFDNADRLSIDLVEADTMAGLVLERLLSESLDTSVFSYMLVYKWMLSVSDFVVGHRDSKGSKCLKEAKNLLQGSPPLTRNFEALKEQLSSTFLLEDLLDLTDRAECMQRKVRESISSAGSYFCRGNGDLSRSEPHARSMADLKVALSQWQGSEDSLSLDQSLEVELKSSLEKLEWLNQTFKFNVLHEDAMPLSRVPLQTLQKLQESSRKIGSDFGNLTLVVDRIERLLSSAAGWLESVNTLTKQAKKRQTGDTGGSVDIVVAHSLDLESVHQLLNHPVLTQVDIPDAATFCVSLRNTLNLEVGLASLLERDFASADKVAIPDSCRSLVGPDGCFLLLRLTGSPLFNSLRRSIDELELFAPKTIEGTPGVEILQWLRAVVQWIDTIATSSVPREDTMRFTISFSKAKELIALGDSIFLTISDDLKKKLGSHKVYVAISKRGKISVKTKRDGAHHSPGATCIRWCPCLYEALKADLQRYDTWDASCATVCKSFLASHRALEEGIQKTEAIQQMLDQRESLWLRLHEASDLVVTPSKSVIHSCRQLLDATSKHIQDKMPLDTFRRFFVARFRDSSVVVDHRSLLLDALLARARIAPTPVQEDFVKSSEDIKNRPYREYCRSVISTALRKVCEKLNLTASTVATVCSVRGWEIENAFFDKFQVELGEKQMSSGYGDKVKALKRALGQSDNVEFGAKVLRNTITADHLAQMDTTEFASLAVKQQREKAAFEAKKALYLTGGTAVVGTPTGTTTTATAIARPAQDGAAAPQITAGSSVEASKPTAEEERPVSTLQKANNSKATSSLRGGGGAKTTQQLIDMVAARKTPSAPPPPPPSLAMAAQPQAPSIGLPMHDKQNVATNDTGGDRFTFTLGHYTFTGALKIERDPLRVGHGLLPEILKDQGRSSPDELKSFLGAKLKGRWEAVTFRVLTSSNSDTIDYKNFYKDFEKKQRVAMFKLAEGSKAFLVTPKFHRFAASISFAKPTSSYLVVLTKRE